MLKSLKRFVAIISNFLFGEEIPFQNKYVDVQGFSCQSVPCITDGIARRWILQHEEDIHPGKKLEDADTWSKRFSKMSGIVASVFFIIAKNIGVNFFIGLLFFQIAETWNSGRKLKNAWNITQPAMEQPWTSLISGLEFLGNVVATIATGLAIALQLGLASVVGGVVASFASAGVTLAYAFKAIVHLGCMLGYLGYGFFAVRSGTATRKASFEMARQHGASFVSSAVIAGVSLGFNILNGITGGLAGLIIGVAGMTIILGVAIVNRIWPIGKLEEKKENKTDGANTNTSFFAWFTSLRKEPDVRPDTTNTNTNSHVNSSSETPSCFPSCKVAKYITSYFSCFSFFPKVSRDSRTPLLEEPLIVGNVGNNKV